jgi:predicted HTH domain antitoxin
VQTKSIRLTDAEAAQLREYLATTGEIEAAALKRAALRGLRELRLEQGILAYLETRNSTAAAEIAGLPRAEFLQVLIDKGITILDGPSTLAAELGALAEHLDSQRLAAVAKQLSEADQR